MEKFTYEAKIKVKGKILPVLNQIPRHEDVWRSRGVVSCILNFDAGWR